MRTARALGADGGRPRTRAALGLGRSAPFDDSRSGACRPGTPAPQVRRRRRWQRAFDAYAQAYPSSAAEFERRVRAATLPRGLETRSARAARGRGPAGAPTIATRKASQQALEVLRAAAARAARRLGRPDRLEPHGLATSSVPVRRQRLAGNHINYGVREFGMSAVDERHRAARRLHSLRRHVPDLLRLQRATPCAWRR